MGPSPTPLEENGVAFRDLKTCAAEHSLRSFLKEAIIIINVIMGCEGRAP